MPTTPIHTMTAALRPAYGGTEVLRTGQVARPVPRAREVLVRVRAAGLDRGAWHMMTGRPFALRLVTGLRRPRSPLFGTELAGTVVAVGSAVTRFVVGDEVFGSGSGSFAEYAVAPEDRLAPRPPDLTPERAAVVPVSGATALQALTDQGHLEAGQRVLVVGASGGVGTFAVQVAKALGAEVTAVCSAEKLDLVRALGADHVVDYRVEDFAGGAVRHDLVVDIGGSSSVTRLRRAATPAGTVVIVGGEGGGPITGVGRQLRAVTVSPFVRQRLVMFVAKQRASDLARLTDLIHAGKVLPQLDRTLPLDHLAEAMRSLEAGEVRGKLAISVGQVPT